MTKTQGVGWIEPLEDPEENCLDKEDSECKGPGTGWSKTGDTEGPACPEKSEGGRGTVPMEKLASARSGQARFGVHGKDLGCLPQIAGTRLRALIRRLNLIQVTFEDGPSYFLPRGRKSW